MVHAPARPRKTSRSQQAPNCVRSESCNTSRGSLAAPFAGPFHNQHGQQQEHRPRGALFAQPPATGKRNLSHRVVRKRLPGRLEQREQALSPGPELTAREVVGAFCPGPVDGVRGFRGRGSDGMFGEQRVREPFAQVGLSLFPQLHECPFLPEDPGDAQSQFLLQMRFGAHALQQHQDIRQRRLVAEPAQGRGVGHPPGAPARVAQSLPQQREVRPIAEPAEGARRPRLDARIG